jgi:heme-degrading monooxygenase HmoA
VVPRPQGTGKTNGVLENVKMQTNNAGQIARSVRFDIATDKTEEFHKLFRNEVLPMLKKQDGFKDELLLVNDEHVLAISVWNNADAARKYDSITYPQVDKTLRPVMKGKPTVETFQYDPLSTI